MLKTSIVVFTSTSNIPIHVQSPTLSTMTNPHPIYVVYLQYGAGRYDAVIPMEEPEGLPPEESASETLPSASSDLRTNL